MSYVYGYDEINRQISISLLPFEEPLVSFTEKEINALNEKIPMTQELYNSVYDKCLILGSKARVIINRLLHDWRYRDFLTERSDKIAEMMGDYDEELLI